MLLRANRARARTNACRHSQLVTSQLCEATLSEWLTDCSLWAWEDPEALEKVFVHSQPVLPPQSIKVRIATTVTAQGLIAEAQAAAWVHELFWSQADCRDTGGFK